MNIQVPFAHRYQGSRLPKFVLLLLLAAVPQFAGGALMFNFSQTGYAGGATVTGSFSGTDLNADGALIFSLIPAQNEITAYSMSFSGNAIVLPFTHTLFDLGFGGTAGLVFVYTGNSFLGDDQVPPEGIGSGPPLALPALSNFTYRTGYGTNQLTDPTTGLTLPFGYVEDISRPVTTLDNAFNFVVVTQVQVPEPATYALLVLGLACAGYARRMARRT